MLRVSSDRRTAVVLIRTTLVRIRTTDAQSLSASLGVAIIFHNVIELATLTTVQITRSIKCRQ